VRTEDETESGRERDSVTGEEKERAETMTGVAVREEAAPWRRCWATVSRENRNYFVSYFFFFLYVHAKSNEDSN
jgi:hypothetical protein